ncbi:MAG TPA: tetratricopeptide repeat protein [Gemmatimonadales bacterium]|nr:tetratricopeptide repeat protein [Gemmatimonadales bacterium]
MRLGIAAALGAVGLGGLSGCATKGQVRLLEAEVHSLRVETARRDSARAAALAAVLTLQQRIMDSLGATQEALRTMDLRVQGDLTDVQRQLLQVQELSGQSQVRLSELKAQLDARADQAAAAGRPGGGGGGVAAPVDTAARPMGPTADQLYQGARNQHTRGARSTARAAYQEFLKTNPTDLRAPDALYYIGLTFGEETPDSATAYYRQVLGQFAQSARAPTALFQLGKLAEARQNPAAARIYYERLLKDYPRSDDAELARDRLKNLRP